MRIRRYPLARQGVYATIQGEGDLLGIPMTFIRLAGCSVHCPECDTDYRLHARATVSEIVATVDAIGLPWVWITGGEPADHDLTELLRALKPRRKIALATSGHRPLAQWRVLVDFLSVSPHSPEKWEVRYGDQLNLVPGLNGLRLLDFVAECGINDFRHRYVTPLYGSKESLAECLAWLGDHPGWRLGVQAHKSWGLP